MPEYARRSNSPYKGLKIAFIILFSIFFICGLIELGLYFFLVRGNNSEDKLKEKVAAAAGAEVEAINNFLYDDYDGDGAKEAFCQISKVNSHGDNYEEIWFVSSKEATNLFPEGDTFQLIGVDGDESASFKTGKQKWLVVTFYGASGDSNLLYTARNGSLYESKTINNLGEAWWTYGGLRGDDLVFEMFGYDLYWETGGKGSLKDYFFYYDSEKGDFVEYGGKQIDRSEVEQLLGRDICSEMESLGYTVDDCYYRANGMVTVNLGKVDETGGIMGSCICYDTKAKEFLGYADPGLEGTGVKVFSGSYVAAVSPENAVYPE